jgi:hypothetical protein
VTKTRDSTVDLERIPIECVYNLILIITAHAHSEAAPCSHVQLHPAVEKVPNCKIKDGKLLK